MRKLVIGCAVAALVALSAPSVARTPASVATDIPTVAPAPYDLGIASWYGEECAGNLTASGEVYDMTGLTAAHWKFPFGTMVRVTNLRNQRTVLVRINDRGPGIEGRIIDLSMEAAKQLAFLRAGLAPVQLEVISEPQPRVSKEARAQAAGSFPAAM